MKKSELIKNLQILDEFITNYKEEAMRRAANDYTVCSNLENLLRILDDVVNNGVDDDAQKVDAPVEEPVGLTSELAGTNSDEQETTE